MSVFSYGWIQIIYRYQEYHISVACILSQCIFSLCPITDNAHLNPWIKVVSARLLLFEVTVFPLVLMLVCGAILKLCKYLILYQTLSSFPNYIRTNPWFLIFFQWISLAIIYFNGQVEMWGLPSGLRLHPFDMCPILHRALPCFLVQQSVPASSVLPMPQSWN